MTYCPPNSPIPPWRSRRRPDGLFDTVPANTPVTRQDFELALCWHYLDETVVSLYQRYEPGVYGGDGGDLARAEIREALDRGLPLERSIPDRFWLWFFFEDLYARGIGATQASVIEGVVDRTQLPGGDVLAQNLAASGVPVSPAQQDLLEGVGASVGLLVGRAFFPLQSPPYRSRSGGAYATWFDFVRSELPESYWRPVVGLFDDLIGGVTSIGGSILSGVNTAAMDIGSLLSTVVQQAAANPVPIVQAIVASQANQLPAGGIMPTVNPDTGSIQTTQASVAGGLLDLLRRYAPGVLGGAAAGGAVELGADAISAIANYFGGSSAMMGCATPNVVLPLAVGQRPPRKVILQRPDGTQFHFTPQGRALLFSKDISAVKRVQRTASRARRSRGARRRALPAPRDTMHVVCGSCLSSPCACSRS